MLTQKRLKELLHYDPENGVFTWIGVRRGHARGHVPRCYQRGYLVVVVDQKRHYGHRLAWLYVHGVWPEHIDHINRKRGDNRLTNLRTATKKQNRANLAAANKLGVKGVRKTRSGKFEAKINYDGKQRYLGTFTTVEEAAKVFREAHESVHGAFAL